MRGHTDWINNRSRLLDLLIESRLTEQHVGVRELQLQCDHASVLCTKSRLLSRSELTSGQFEFSCVHHEKLYMGH